MVPSLPSRPAKVEVDVGVEGAVPFSSDLELAVAVEAAENRLEEFSCGWSPRAMYLEQSSSARRERISGMRRL